MPSDLIGLRSAQEADEANAVEWVRRTDGAGLLRIWMKIQAMGGSPDLEIISRLAQLGMSHAVLLAERKGE